MVFCTICSGKRSIELKFAVLNTLYILVYTRWIKCTPTVFVNFKDRSVNTKEKTKINQIKTDEFIQMVQYVLKLFNTSLEITSFLYLQSLFSLK